jgi:hypothetical protein
MLVLVLAGAGGPQVQQIALGAGVERTRSANGPTLEQALVVGTGVSRARSATAPGLELNLTPAGITRSHVVGQPSLAFPPQALAIDAGVARARSVGAPELCACMEIPEGVSRQRSVAAEHLYVGVVEAPAPGLTPSPVQAPPARAWGSRYRWPTIMKPPKRRKKRRRDEEDTRPPAWLHALVLDLIQSNAAPQAPRSGVGQYPDGKANLPSASPAVAAPRPILHTARAIRRQRLALAAIPPRGRAVNVPTLTSGITDEENEVFQVLVAHRALRYDRRPNA